MISMEDALASYDESHYSFPDNPIHRIRVPPPCHRDALNSAQERRRFDVLVLWLLHQCLEESTLEISYVFTRGFQRCKKKDNCYYELMVRPKESQDGVAFDAKSRRTEVDVLAALTRCLHVVGACEVTPCGSVSMLLEDTASASLQLKLTCIHNRTTQTPYLAAPRQDAYPRVIAMEGDDAAQEELQQLVEDYQVNDQEVATPRRQTARKSTGGARKKNHK